MEINSIKSLSPFTGNLTKSSNTKLNETTDVCDNSKKNIGMYSYPSGYYLNFTGARVDKDLNSFYARNLEYMPQTFKAYVESLDEEEKALTTPLEAQYKAFEYLDICDTPDDIKSIYPDEPLFSELKTIDESKATHGLIYDIKLMREDIKEFDEKVLKDNQDLTVYLVKKAFLEGKTIKEINDDLDTDLNPVFQKEDKNYIGSSTLKALGIQLPKTEYLTSLRYTRDGYSDAMGEKMRARWINLSAQEKEEFKNSIKEGEADKEASLTEEEKIERQQTRSEAQKQRWAKMTPEEKTEQIQSLMNGSKKQRIIMINAWNNSPEIRDALSREMTAFHITNPISKIYKTNNHSKEMSKVMTEFWKKNANFADKIGDEIALSMEAFENAKKAGKEEEFIDATLKKQKEIFEILQKEKEKELTTYAAMTIACVRQLHPLYPFNAAAEFGIFQAKPAYAGTKADIAKFEKEHPTMETEARYARFKGLLDCASDDTREILANRGIKIKELDELCKQAEAGKKEVTITPEGGKSYTIKFDKAPSQDDIDKYFIEYQTPLNDEEKSKIAKEIEKKLKEDSMHSVFNVAGIKNSINKFGGVSREILHGDEKMKSLLLNAITNDFLEGEICKKYKAAQKAGKESQFRAMMDKVLAETV